MMKYEAKISKLLMLASIEAEFTIETQFDIVKMHLGCPTSLFILFIEKHKQLNWAQKQSLPQVDHLTQIQIICPFLRINNNKIGMLTKKSLLLIVVGLVTGAFNTLGLSIQSKQHVLQGGIDKTFFHPYMQAALKPASYLLILLLIPFTNRKFQNEHEGSFNPFLLIIPITLEIIANCCYFFALNFVSSSSYQMLRGSNILVAYLISVLFFKNQMSRQKFFGCVIVILGLVSIGAVNLLFNQGKSHESNISVLGFCVILIGVIFTGLRFAFQEQLVKRHKVDPFWIIGLEGLFGLIISAIYIPLLSIISCPFGVKACVINDNGKMVFQDFSVFMRGMLNNDLILMGGIVLVITFSMYCLSGILISKEMSAMARSMVDVTRSLLIWMIGILVTATFGVNDKKFRWESLNLMHIGGQAIGFSVLVLGSLIYYQIITLKIFEENEQIGTSILAQECMK